MFSRIIRIAALARPRRQPSSSRPLGCGRRPGHSGWTPYEQPDIDYAAGFRCEFAMHGEVLKDHEEFKDVAFWPDGSVRTQLWRGALVIRWSNVETGESVVRDQSAKAVAEYGSDGALDKMTSMGGAFSAGVPRGRLPRARASSSSTASGARSSSRTTATARSPSAPAGRWRTSARRCSG